MGVKVLSWNAHSIRNKHSELSILIDNLDIDIILVSESWLTEDISFEFQGFSSYRADRFRGGTAIFIKSSIPHSNFTKSQFEFGESCSVSISVENQIIKITSIYCSPAATRAQSKLFYSKILSYPGPHIVAGDYNCKHFAWNNSSVDSKGQDLFDLLEKSNYSIVAPSEPTLYPYIGEPSCVDFVVTKSCNLIENVDVINDLSSDHLPIFFTMDVHFAKPFIPNLLKTNWKKFQGLVDSYCKSTTLILDSPTNIDLSIENLTTALSDSLINSSPAKTRPLTRYKYSPHVANLIKNRNHFRNLFKRTRDPSYRSSVNQLNKLIRNQVRVEKYTAWEDKLRNLSFTDCSLYSISKSLKRKRRSIPPLKDVQGHHFSDKDKAEAFARVFKQSFEISVKANSKFEAAVEDSIHQIHDSHVSEFPHFSEVEVISILRSLNPKKACGPDDLPNVALSSLSSVESFSKVCTSIFNACLELSYFPKSWKIAKILAIPKTAAISTDPDKYRPISLISCFGKCLEKLILNRLNDHEEDNNIFIQQQCGFRSKHSTIHQILRITETISFGFNNNKSTAMVLLDLRKAFDCVWHDGLIHKLRKYDYPLYIIKIIQSYLSERSAFVAMPAAFSDPFSVLSGVPQGSLISPHLFNLFINDIPIPRNGHLSLFADDTAFYVQVPWKNLKSAKTTIVKALISLQTYFNDWKIFLNEDKTEFIIFSKSTKMLNKTKTDIISLNNKTFEWRPVVKYLGIYLDSKLLFKHHIDYSINKAKGISFSSLYCLLNRKSVVSIDSKVRVYKTYIRPVLTYGCQIFINAAKCHLSKLQLLQNKILRMILNTDWSDFVSTSAIHDSTNVPLMNEFIGRITDNFYSRISYHPNNLFSSLGNYTSDSLTFRVKHKLPKALT